MNKVNERDSAYSKYLTYEETHTMTNYDSSYGYTDTTYTTTENYTLAQILNNPDSPIPAARDIYENKLKIAKENLAELEKKDKEAYDELSGLSDTELVEATFPTQLGEYQRLRSTWKENNQGWLKWVDIGGKVLATAAIIAGSIMSGGTAAPLLIAAGTTYLVADSGYQAVVGETMITGDVLDTDDRDYGRV